MHTTYNPGYIFLISFIAALGGLMFGFDIAIISGAIPFIRQYFNLSELQLGWGVSCLLVGCIFGSMVAGKLADQYGRKKMLIIVALLFAISSVWTALAEQFLAFVVARLVGGIAVGAASILSPLYIAEVAPHTIRGKLVSLNQLTLTLGILASYLINYLLHDIGEDNWRWMFASGALPSVLFFGLLFVVPQSPRWLFLKGRKKEAFEVLKKIGGDQNAIEELHSLEDTRSEAEAGFHELYKSGYRKMMAIGIVLAILIQISGINTIIDYAPIIFESAGNTIDTALFQTFIIGFINFAFTFIAIFTIDKAGRKILYATGSAGMALTLLLLSLAFMLGRAEGWVGMVLILGFIAFFASCIGPVFWVLVSEIFPGPVRGTAMSVAVLTNWFMNFIVVLFFPSVLSLLGGAGTFGILAFMSLLMLLFTLKYVPETKGKTLEEIEQFWARR